MTRHAKHSVISLKISIYTMLLHFITLVVELPVPIEPPFIVKYNISNISTYSELTEVRKLYNIHLTCYHCLHVKMLHM